MPRTLSYDPPPLPGTAGMWKEYQIEVATPLFGGGTRAGEPDRDFPVRGTAVRGHLRFWWRAVNGHAFADAEQLFAAESAIWGNTERSSKIDLTVEVKTPGELKRCAARRPEKNFYDFTNGTPPYALFPFQGVIKRGVEEQPAKDALHGTAFVLKLSFPPELEETVERTVWAWVNFGGIGARTRRGCGSLLCKVLAPSSSDPESLASWIRRNLGRPLAPQRMSALHPLLAKGIWIGESQDEAFKSWFKAVDMMRLFRQGEDIGRNSGKDRPGRSRWPEPDSLRRLTKQNADRHDLILEFESAFPRAAFGLPIICHFKDPGDPYPDPQLLPPSGDSGRMASPFILKALTLSDGRRSLPMALRLWTPPLEGIKVTHGQGEQVFGKDSIENPQFSLYNNSPMENRSAVGSALEAFESFIVEKGFREVTA